MPSKKRVFFLLIVAVSAAIGFWACDDDKPTSPARPRTSSEAPLLPLALGNYWIYADTIWINGVPQGRIDTVEVVGQLTDTLGDWWLLSGWLFNLGTRVIVRGDSIVTYQCCIVNPEGEHEYSEVEYVPAVDTPFVHEMILDGDIMFYRTVNRVDSSITTAAGKFSGLFGSQTARSGTRSRRGSA